MAAEAPCPRTSENQNQGSLNAILCNVTEEGQRRVVGGIALSETRKEITVSKDEYISVGKKVVRSQDFRPEEVSEDKQRLLNAVVFCLLFYVVSCTYLCLSLASSSFPGVTEVRLRTT